MGKGDKQEPEFPPLSDEEPSAQQLEEFSDRVTEAAERVDEVSMEQWVQNWEEESIKKLKELMQEEGSIKEASSAVKSKMQKWFEDFDASVNQNVKDLMQDVGTTSIESKRKNGPKAQTIEEYNEQNIREMDGLLPASAFPEPQKIKKSVSTKEVRPVLNTKHLKKGGNPIYLTTMKALRKFYKKADRLDAIIFREEYVLPTINGLIESNKKAGEEMVLAPQMKDAFEELMEQRRKKVTIGHGFTDYLSAVEINGKIKTRNQLLKSFADAIEKAGDQQLAASCKWAIRSLASKAKHIGKSMVGIKPKKRNENRSSEVGNSGQGFGV